MKVPITVKSGEGEAEMIEVARLERGRLRPDTLGLSLTEARSILAGREQTIAQRQVAEFIAQEQRCPQCGRDCTCKRIFEKSPPCEAGFICTITGVMSTRAYVTDLNDSTWAWVAPYLPEARPGGRPVVYVEPVTS